MKLIHSIKASSGQAIAYYRSGDYTGSVPVVVGVLPTEAQTVWAAALGWFAAQGLREGETLAGDIVLDVSRDAAVAATEEQEVEGETVQVPAAWRHVLRASAPVRNAAGQQREAQSSSEDMPEELRASFLALFAQVEGMINI